MKKLLIILSMLFTLLPGVSLAAGNLNNALGNLGTTGAKAGTTQGDVGSVLGTLINGALTLVGTIFFILMVYAGYLWMTARGEEAIIDKAKDIIRASIIGLVVILSAYAITVFVTSRFDTGAGGGAHCEPSISADATTCPGGTGVCGGLDEAACSAAPSCCTWFVSGR